MNSTCVAAIILALSIQAPPPARAVFAGLPSIKVSEAGLSRTPETLDPGEASRRECVIRESGGKYFWASRENKPLVRTEAGAFVTYMAVDGSGYIRTVAAEMKAAAAILSPTEDRFDYVEHLAMGLRSVTYWGVHK